MQDFLDPYAPFEEDELLQQSRSSVYEGYCQHPVSYTHLPTVSNDYGIPLLTVTLDEHAGEAGLLTRLGAFVDMLNERRRSRIGSEIIASSTGN